MSSNDELSSDTSSLCDVESLQLAVEGECSFNSIVQRYRKKEIILTRSVDEISFVVAYVNVCRK